MQNVDSPESLQCRSDDGRNIFFMCQVQMKRQAHAASLLDQPCDLFGSLEMDVGNDHAGAALRQQERRGRANPAGAPRDDRYLIV
jgi:hypothetical protein